jgi:hypothetical protein
MVRDQPGAVISGAWLYPAVAVALVAVHGVRVLQVKEALAVRWLTTRGFQPNARAVHEVQSYLRRLRIARLVGAAVFLVLGVLSVAAFQIPLGVLSGPYLLAVLGAELHTPRPRRGRARAATLVRRPADYFAPRRAVLTVRALLVVGSVISAIVAVQPHPVKGAVHLAVLLAGALIYESCLRVIATRGLPLATGDLQRDTAIRVASSHTSTAAALSFASFGTVYAASLFAHDQSTHWVGRPIVNQLMTWGTIATLAGVIWLLQPVTAWKPRKA